MKTHTLVINPGSTSTKIGVYKGASVLFTKSIEHSLAELEQCSNILEQLAFRKKVITDTLTALNFDTSTLSLVIGRGGLIKPGVSGIYPVNEKMKADLLSQKYGYHASNLGGLLALNIATPLGIGAYIVDPVVTDELQELARIAGLPDIQRKSIFHALNQKSVAKIYAQSIHKNYKDLNLIVVHLGGGVSIGAHKQGKVIDVNDALYGEGPFSPERSGTLPMGDLVDMCFSGKYSKEEVRKKLVGHGGFVAHVGTNKIKDVVESAKNGDKQAILLLDTFTYQIAKYIGMMATVLYGKVDQIILTGGVAYNSELMQQIIERVSFIANVTIFPGEDEMQAMANAAVEIIDNTVTLNHYL